MAAESSPHPNPNPSFKAKPRQIDREAIYIIHLAPVDHYCVLHTPFFFFHLQIPPPPHELQVFLVVKSPQTHEVDWRVGGSVGAGVGSGVAIVGGEVDPFVGASMGEEVGKAIERHVHGTSPVGLTVGCGEGGLVGGA
eukprot:CAMPEP_0201876446 /NCGR_PEP_ID=MMETSP0902-20130614/8137_1 /ASSEMBLY_ACC=CAM_ASM_000551 /TAXON_ID=420261 /ORGANISM="Thalassiosira antarctica, Strain CCMP982" /LENGTH=137 /DNA_ID=CAMNT_0048403697 /DNA_START=128 /DNA_END=539 /DNA_ORIENTATION=+